MGITISYGAELKKSEKYLIPKILRMVETYAVKYGYEYQLFNKLEGYVEKNKLFKSDGSLDHIWYSFMEFFNEDSNCREEYKKSGFKEDDSQKKSTQECIIIHNKKGEEYLSESFEVGFSYNPFTKKYFWSGFTKTQIFNENETIPNLKFHIFIIKILEQIKLRFIPNVDINDEANYFFTEQEREENIVYWKEKLKDRKSPYNDVAKKYIKKWENIKPYQIKNLVESHGSNLKLIGSIGGMLGDLGFDNKNVETPIKGGIEFLEDFINKLNTEFI